MREIQREGDGRLVFRCVNGGVGGSSKGAATGGGGRGGGEGERNSGAASSLPPGETSLLDVVRDGFLLGGERGTPACHRVAVVDFEDDDDGDDEEEEEEGDGGDGGGDAKMMRAAQAPPGGGEPDSLRVIAIVSQSDVIRFLARHLGELKSSGENNDEGGGGGREPTARELATSPVAAVAAAMPASLALASLFQQRGRVSAAAIVSAGHGELVGSLSASDLRGLGGGGGGGGGGPGGSLRALGLPVGEFVEARARARAAAASAAASAAAADDSDGGLEEAARAPPPPLLAVSPDTPFS